mmetsp:Transcript_3897/g.5910  ORF Transcript_3897/g.5910 Transcript_3897/m.5910 type:complete len:316 (-) Transcript_3897:30-977(-)
MATRVENLDLGTESYIFCISFNFHGNRLALSSADQSIQVWDHTQSGWKLSARWNAHSGAIFKVRWAHPEFGTLLASCSFDKSVNIYEENAGENSWNTLANLVESKEPIEDIRFAPKHLGLQLAVCSSNGEIRIYEPSNSVNLKVWSVAQMFLSSPLGSNCIAWNPSPIDPPMLIVGNNDAETAREKFCKQFSEEASLLQLWVCSTETKTWQNIYTAPEAHKLAVVDLDWAQLMGRRKHLVCSCSLDSTVVVWRVDGNQGIIELEQVLTGHTSKVWKVCWDLLGTTICSTGDDSKVKVWKRNLNKEWNCIEEIENP